MKHLKEYHNYTWAKNDDYTSVEMSSDMYGEIPKKKMDDYTIQQIEKTMHSLTDDWGIRDSRDNSVEYWDVKTFDKPTRITIFETDDEYFYILTHYNYHNICHKCDQLSGLINCINNGYGV